MVPFANAGNQEHSVNQGQAKIINLPPIDSYPEPNIQWYEGYGTTIHTGKKHLDVKAVTANSAAPNAVKCKLLLLLCSFCKNNLHVLFIKK